VFLIGAEEKKQSGRQHDMERLEMRTAMRMS
jgi:hypothetical protein